MKFKLLNAVLLAVTLLVTGCANTRTLAPDGPYGRLDSSRPPVESGLTLGQQLVRVDQLITGGQRIIDQFLAWELTNRSHHGSESLARFAVRLSNEAPQALQSAVRVRDAYAGNPTPETRSKLDDALRVIDALLLEVGRHRKA